MIKWMEHDEIARIAQEYGGVKGMMHTQRLLALVPLIAEGRQYNADVVWLAAHLHDWGAYKPWAQPGVDHTARSVEVARAWLTEHGCPAEFAAQVIECIGFHHSKGTGASVEAVLMRDADVVDLLGVVGVVRDFLRQPQDFRAGYDAARKRRANLAGVVTFPKAKEIAATRLAEMDAVLDSFAQETFGYF